MKKEISLLPLSPRSASSARENMNRTTLSTYLRLVIHRIHNTDQRPTRFIQRKVQDELHRKMSLIHGIRLRLETGESSGVS